MLVKQAKGETQALVSQSELIALTVQGTDLLVKRIVSSCHPTDPISVSVAPSTLYDICFGVLEKDSQVFQQYQTFLAHSNPACSTIGSSKSTHTRTRRSLKVLTD